MDHFVGVSYLQESIPSANIPHGHTSRLQLEGDTDDYQLVKGSKEEGAHAHAHTHTHTHTHTLQHMYGNTSLSFLPRKEWDQV